MPQCIPCLFTNLLGTKNHRTKTTISNSIPSPRAQDSGDPRLSVLRPHGHGHDTVGMELPGPLQQSNWALSSTFSSFSDKLIPVNVLGHYCFHMAAGAGEILKFRVSSHCHHTTCTRPSHFPFALVVWILVRYCFSHIKEDNVLRCS